MVWEPDAGPGTWLEKADEDLSAARALLHEALWDLAAFHAQQAGEKALKAVVIARLRRVDRTHNLMALAKTLKAGPDVEKAAAFLAPMYAATRSPDASPGVTEQEARKARDAAEEVVRWARTQLS